MSTKMPRLLLLACVVCPSMTWALGLGEIHLHSALGAPLSADIDLIAATPRDIKDLHAELAPVDEYQRYGISHPPYLGTFHFSIAKSATGQPVLHVTSTDSIPDPFVTFLVEVDWARGRLLREYTVLLDPPVYASGQSAESPAPVAVPQSTAPTQATPPAEAEAAPAPAASESVAPATAAAGSLPQSVHVAAGDTLSMIARRLGAQSTASVDRTMLALFRENPSAFDGNVNLLHRGAILRVPSADRIAALSEHEAIAQIDQQMTAWRARGGASGGHLRLVPPAIAAAGSGASGSGASGTGAAAGVRAQNASLRAQVQTLQTQLAGEQRLVTVQNQELASLQAKLGLPVRSATAPASTAASTPAASAASVAAAPASTSAGASAASVAAAPATPAAKPAAKAPQPATSWLDWISNNWWLPGGLIALLAGGLGFAAFKRRQREQDDELDSFTAPATREPPPVFGQRKPPEESFVVEESGEHRAPTIPPAMAAAVAAAPAAPVAATEAPSPDDTMSTESAVNIDQGDPLAEADFHMAYGLYDQAADLVRIALEREPDRRDLRLKLLEIYFVWGNKDLFLQTAKSLYETRDRAPVGEWDKIVIMGKQICPEEPLFAHATGAGRGAGAPVDLNLEGGENRVDVDLFGEPPGEHSPHEPPAAKDADETAATGESPQLHGDSGLDFVLDAPERGADESPTREMSQRDEPTVESEIMSFAEPNVAESPTTESPALAAAATDGSPAAKAKAATTDQTAEVSIDDLGLDLEGLERTGTPDSGSAAHLEPTDHPANAATMIAGLDERSRRMMADAENRTQDRDLTELERELEASFIADLDSSHTEIKTAVLPADAVPTMQIPQVLRDAEDAGATSRVPSFKEPEAAESAARPDPDSTSRLQSVGDGLDLDLDRLAGALGGDTVEQPRAAEDVFSSEVFEASRSVHSAIDLDVGAPLHEDAGNGATTLRPDEATMPPMDGAAPTEFEPVTMSEVGTKLDLARAYMDMGDPEGARSILDEVVQEGSASQKQEAERLLQSLPG